MMFAGPIFQPLGASLSGLAPSESGSEDGVEMVKEVVGVSSPITLHPPFLNDLQTNCDNFRECLSSARKDN